VKQSEGYAVLLCDPAAEPLAPLHFLAGLKGWNRDSARTFLLRQPGFLGRALTREAAAALTSDAAAAGFLAAIADEGSLPAPPPPVKVLKLSPGEDGFEVVTGGVLKTVAYATVTILAASAYDAHLPPPNMDALKDSLIDKLMRLTGTPAFSPVSEKGAKETFFRADILAENGDLRLLLEPENMDFSPLGLARAHSNLENFKTLLGRLAPRCPGAVSTPFLAALLANRPLAALKPSSPEACDAALSRLMFLSARPAR
jgi:hypothetical protein